MRRTSAILLIAVCLSAACSAHSERGANTPPKSIPASLQTAVERARSIAVANDRENEAIPEDLRFHDLGHTCAAILIANGRHMEEVKDQLGHSSIRVTSDRYGHLFPSARIALAEGLEAIFQEASEELRADNLRAEAKFLEISDPTRATG